MTIFNFLHKWYIKVHKKDMNYFSRKFNGLPEYTIKDLYYNEINRYKQEFKKIRPSEKQWRYEG